MHYTYDIHLPKDENSNLNNYFSSDDLENPIEYLKNFNEINIFVGANNSGKSRFMRELMRIGFIEGINNVNIVKEKIEEYNNLIKEFDFEQNLTYEAFMMIKQYYKGFNVFDNIEFYWTDILVLKEINTKNDLSTIISQINNNIKNFEKVKSFFHTYSIFPRQFVSILEKKAQSIKYYQSRKEKIPKIEHILLRLGELYNNKISIDGNKIYIPTLRTAHSIFKEKENDSKNFKKIRDDIFLDTTRKNYHELNIITHEERKSLEDERFQKGNTNSQAGDIDVFTGMNLYNEIINVRNSKKEKRDRFLEFEEFLKTYFFEGKTVDIVAEFNVYRQDAAIETDDEIQVFIGDKSEKLYNLGDGIQALIILMYKIFLADKDSVIFIDEPEINLHPGYQRLFLEQITNNDVLIEKNLTYVIVTHSNHFLDLTLEKDNVSIYSFSSLPKEENEEDKFMIRNVNAGDNQLLRNLGVNNSSVFLANSSIWVEGISDRNFIKAFLEAYCKAEKKKVLPREDIDFAFFEYAGANLTHYDFRGTTSEGKGIQRLINSYALNNRIFLLSDLDDGKSAKHKTLKQVADDNENFIYKTTKPYREIENILPNEVWEKVLVEFWNQTKIKDEASKQKAQEKITEALTSTKSESYKKEYIGEFLNALSLDDLNQIWEKDKNGKHKTFKQKAKLSEIILRKVRNNEITWEDFAKNETIVQLTEAIYNFIKNT